jgi:hypothetical protein
MPGLLLSGQGGVGAVAGNGMSTPSKPSTASQAAFGQYGGNVPSSMNALTPTDPFGISLWTAVIAAGLLLLIRHSLPA